MCDDSTIKKYVIILLSDAILDKSKETKQIIYRYNEYLYTYIYKVFRVCEKQNRTKVVGPSISSAA